MLKNYRNRTGYRAIDNNRLIIFGNGKVVSLNLIEKFLIQALIIENIRDNAVCYEKFIFNNVLYHAST